MTTTTSLNSVLLHSDSRCGTDLSAWMATIGGKGLERALQNPEKIISIIKDADLKGLGGSGFPTHKKWEIVAKQTQSDDRYLICNGNEDEPGTFKDRTLLEETPHQIIEGALITALATGINHIVFYINPNQKKSLDNIEHCISQWQATDYIKSIEKIIGRSLTFRIMASPGLYIGGEETAAIEAVEGKFPFPRGKPPFPALQGVNNQPTLINNIETLANISHILRNGAQWYKNLGLGSASGTKLYCLSGDVVSPGIYELPMGTSLKELIYQYGGGILNDKKLTAVFTGGPSNTLLTPKDIDVALDFDSVAERHSSLGTGAMIILSEDSDLIKQVADYMDFFAESSCGQCPSCKIGTSQLSSLLKKINAGKAKREDLDTLINLGKMLPGSGLCHLPNGAAKLLGSALYYFTNEFQKKLVV